MFDKLKELFNKNKSSDSDDELLDFSEYADIQGGSDSTEVDEGTAKRTLEAIRSSESLAASDKTVVPDLKTEIRQSSIQKKSPSPADDATEIVGNSSSDNFLSGLKEKFGELINRSKSSDELEIESFDEEGDDKKRTVVRLILILLIAVLIMTIIDDFFVEEAPQPVQKERAFEPPEQDEPLEAMETDQSTEVDDSAMDDPADAIEAEGPEAKVEPEVDLEVDAENMDNAEADLLDNAADDSNETTTESEEMDETESQSEVPTEEADNKNEESSAEDVMTEIEEIPAPPTTTPPVEEPVIEDTTVEEVEGGIGLSKEELVQIENELAKENNTDDISNLSDLNVNYLATGSGLVYNCVGKHWACISKVNFVKCNKLSVMNPKRCFAVKYYSDKRSCQVQQIKNIDSNKSTHFCY